jgi:hypothetical protein
VSATHFLVEEKTPSINGERQAWTYQHSPHACDDDDDDDDDDDSLQSGGTSHGRMGM